jgi:WD repeat-containing protein 35
VTLAEEHDFPQIEGLLSKYAQHLLSNGRRMEAVELYRKVLSLLALLVSPKKGTNSDAELYRKANRQPEAARLLSEMAIEEVKARANPKRARSLFVLAALEVEKFRDKTLKVVATGTMATMQQTMAGKATMAGGKGKPTMAAGGAKGTMATMQTLGTQFTCFTSAKVRVLS